jgi:hypothetical protein
MAKTNDPAHDAAWKLYRQLVERAWSDPAFKERLQKDPKGTLQAEINAAGLDISLPDQIKIVEDSDKLAHFALRVGGPIIC